MLNQRLFQYAENGNLLGVAELLARGADINWRNPEWVGQTALHVASLNGHSEVVKELLMHSEVNPNAVDDFGWTSLHSASFYSHVGVVKELLKTPGLNHNAKAKDGWTALHSASYSGKKDVVNELLQLPQMDLRAETDNGYTFLDIALKMENLEIVQLPKVVEFLLEELTILRDQLKVSEIQLEGDLTESWRRQVNNFKRLKNLGSQLRVMKSVIDPNLQKQIDAVLQSEKETSDFISKIEKSIEDTNSIKNQDQKLVKDVLALKDVVVRDANNFEGEPDAISNSRIAFDDLTNTFQDTYCDENNFLCGADFGWVKTVQMTSGAFATSSIVLVLFIVYSIASCMQYYRARSKKGTFRELWWTKSPFWTITCGLITLILNLIMELLPTESEDSLTSFEDSVATLEMPKGETRTTDMNYTEMKSHFEDQLKKLHEIYALSIRECKSDLAEKVEKLTSETERLKAEMTKMKKKISMFAERPINIEANRVKSVKRARSLGHETHHRQDRIIFDKTDIIYDQLRKTV